MSRRSVFPPSCRRSVPRPPHSSAPLSFTLCLALNTPERMDFQPETKEPVAHGGAPITIFRYGNQISLSSTSTGLIKTQTRTHARTHVHAVPPIAEQQHKQKAILIKGSSPNTGSILLLRSLGSRRIQTPFLLFSALFFLLFSPLFSGPDWSCCVGSLCAAPERVLVRLLAGRGAEAEPRT